MLVENVMRFIALTLSLGLAACGQNPLCERLTRSSDAFFAQKQVKGAGTLGGEICDGPPKITSWSRDRRMNNTCTNGLSKCTASETNTIIHYLQCLEAAPPCTVGNEKNAAMAVDACIQTMLKSGLSPECVVALE